MKTVLRFHYRSNLKDNYDSGLFERDLEACKQRVSLEICKERILTCGLFHYQDMLFLYIEFIVEKQELENVNNNDLYTEIAENLCEPLASHLKVWPGINGDRIWVSMAHIYCSAYPENLEEWKRPVLPDKRCGRIAIFYPDKVYSYVYHHYAIVKEGYLKGDKYQSIALHENIAFSYFETPRDRYITSVKRDSSQESIELQKWTDVNPESHFVHLPGSKGQNFMEIPCYFTLSHDT